MISRLKIRTKRVKVSKAPWISSHLKDEMHKWDILKIKAIRSNDPLNWHILKKMRNSVNQNIVGAKENYFKRAFCENKGGILLMISRLKIEKARIYISEVDLNGDLAD